MNGPVERVSATRQIAVPAHQVFLAVTDPACHVRIDGSGMLQNVGGARRLTAAGDTFDIVAGPEGQSLLDAGHS